MTYTLVVNCIKDAFTKKEKKVALGKFKLPKPSKNGCSTLPDTDIELPNGTTIQVICETNKYGNTLGVYEKGTMPSDINRILGIKSDGAFTITYQADESTEIILELTA